MKILILGTDQINFVRQLCQGIRELDQDFNFFSLHGSGFSKHDADSAVVTTLSKRSLFPFILFTPLTSLGYKMFWDTILYILFIERKLFKALHFAFYWNKDLALSLANGRFKNIDVFHFHFLQFSYLRMINFIPPHKKVVCTFWGSDLLRTGDSLNHLWVRRALDRADIITTHSEDHREIILAKYGRHLKGKIRLVKFPPEKKLYDAIDTMEKSVLDSFSGKLGIPKERIVIVVGHNASRFNNHIEIVRQLIKLESKGRYFLVFPFTYGADQKGKVVYKLEIEELLSKSEFDYVFLEEFMSWQDLAALRIRGDIMIHAPGSDALSGAMTESLYAGNIVITGGWLPYKPFKQAGLIYVTIDSFTELPEKMEEIYTDLKEYRQRAANNNQNVKNHFFSEVTSRGWLTMFREL